MTTPNKLSLAGFVFLSALIVLLASERVYWYWSGFNADSTLALAGIYLLPTMVALWALALAPAYSAHQVVLAGAIFAFVVEGVLTPVVYLDGPLPIMAAMFMGWHGLLAFVGFWYLVRRWLLARQLRPLVVGSLGFGAIWGLWTLSSAVSSPLEAEEVADLGFEPSVLLPGEFLVYAAQVGVTLTLSHWLIGFVWPPKWTPGTKSTWGLAILAYRYMAVAVLPGVLWAPPQTCRSGRRGMETSADAARARRHIASDDAGTTEWSGETPRRRRFAPDAACRRHDVQAYLAAKRLCGSDGWSVLVPSWGADSWWCGGVHMGVATCRARSVSWRRGSDANIRELWRRR